MMLKPKTNIDKPIPTLESVSESYRKLLERRDALVAEDHALDAETATIKLELAEQNRASLKDDRVAALVAGVTYEEPAPVRERLGNISRKKDLIHAALSEIAGKLVGEHMAASRLIVAEFLPEQGELAAEFYRHLTAAVGVHSKLGKLRDRLEKAGLNSGGLHDFGREILGSPNRRDDHAGYAFRDGLKRGYIEKTAVPQGYL